MAELPAAVDITDSDEEKEEMKMQEQIDSSTTNDIPTESGSNQDPPTNEGGANNQQLV